MQLVEELLDKYQTEDPFKLSEYLGFEVVFQPLPEKIRSSFVRTNSTNYIVLNTRTSRTAQTANCVNEMGKYLLSSHRREVSYHTVDECESYKTDLTAFIIDMCMKNSLYNERNFIKVSAANGLPKHIAEHLLNVWKDYKQRESGLYVRK
jgi:hypothetical protein